MQTARIRARKRWHMRVRPNIFLISSLLFTPAFFWLLPSAIECVRSTESMTRTAGFSALTIIIVALIVIWTGLAAGNRVAWIVMLVIVWVWAFPIMMLFRLVTHIGALSLGDLNDWVVSAWRQNGIARITLINLMMFSLMLIGLILPVRALLRIGKPQ